MSASVADSLLSHTGRIPTDFQHQMLCMLLFLSVLLCVGDPCMRLRPHALVGRGFCSQDIPLDSQPLHVSSRVKAFHISSLLISFYMASSVNHLCNISIQLIFSWLFRLIAL